MGQDEDKNFDSGTTPVNGVPFHAQITNNRIGMRPARTFSAKDELERISGRALQENGDIVLNNAAKPKKNKMIVTVVAIMVALAVILGGVLIFQLIEKNNRPKYDGLDYAELVPIKEDIKNYLALLQGGDVDAEYDRSMNVMSWYTVQAVTDSHASADKKYQHAIRMETQYNNMVTAINSLSDSKTKEQLTGLFSKTKRNYYAVREYLKNDYIGSIVIDTYLKDGYDASKNLLDEYNTSIKDISDDDTWKKFYKDMVSIRSYSLDVVVVLDQYGCTINGYIDEECADMLRNDPNVGVAFVDMEKTYMEKDKKWQNSIENYAKSFCGSANNIGFVLSYENSK